MNELFSPAALASQVLSYENIPVTEILSSLKVAKKYMHVYYFHGKHFTCWDLRGMLETENFG